MPRTVFDKKRDKLFILLNGSAAGKSRDELGAIIGKGAQTAGTRLNSPDTLTVGELKKLCRSLHIPLEDLRQAITY